MKRNEEMKKKKIGETRHEWKCSKNTLNDTSEHMMIR